MIKIFLLIIALVAGLVVGPELAGGQGYVLISVANQTVEMSLTTLVILVIALLIAVVILEWIIKRILGFSSSTRSWFSGRKVRNARKNTAIGLRRLHEGDWIQAEKLISKSAPFSDSPLVNYLSAAQAAQGLGNTKKRDEFLKLANDQQGNNELVVGLTRARLDIEAGQYETALANLKALKKKHDQNKLIMQLLKDVALQLNDWETIIPLIPNLRKYRLMGDEELKTLEIDSICGKMHTLALTQDASKLLAYWNRTLTRKNKQNQDIIATFVEQMVTLNADADAYMILRDATKRNPNERLIALIPKLNLDDYQPVVKHLKNLLKSDNQNVTTLRALALVFIKMSDWNEAQSYLEKVVAITRNTEDYAKLATVLEKLEDPKGAEVMAREALLQNVD